MCERPAAVRRASIRSMMVRVRRRSLGDDPVPRGPAWAAAVSGEASAALRLQRQAGPLWEQRAPEQAPVASRPGLLREPVWAPRPGSLEVARAARPVPRAVVAREALLEPGPRRELAAAGRPVPEPGAAAGLPALAQRQAPEPRARLPRAGFLRLFEASARVQDCEHGLGRRGSGSPGRRDGRETRLRLPVRRTWDLA